MDKTYLKNTVVSLVTSLLSVFLIFYIINQVNIIGRDDVTIQYATNDNSTVSIRMEGMLCFSEAPVYAPSGYSYIHSVGSGKGVEKGSTVATLYSIAHSDTVELIERIDSQIAYLEKCSDVRGGTLDTVDYDKQVKDNYLKLVDMIYSGNLSGSASVGEDWLVAKSKRNVSIGVISGYGDSIERLKSQRQTLVSGIGYSVGGVTSPDSGVYYSFYDGYESFVTVDAVKNGDYAKLDGMLEGGYADDGANGMKIGKVVTSSKWYTVCRVSGDEAAALTVGQTYPASFDENGAAVKVKLERVVVEYGSDGAMLVFSCDTNLDDFIGHRYLTLDLTVGSYSGLGVPCSAVRYVDGAVGVYIVDGNKARFRKIHITAEKGGRYIVKQYPSDSEEYADHLKLYDSIITSGKNVYDGKYVELA